LITEEEDAELDLFIQRQMEQEEIDRRDLKAFHEKQQQCNHSYIFVGPLLSDEEDVYQEKWCCISCFEMTLIMAYFRNIARLV
jgi:hypothetical protein